MPSASINAYRWAFIVTDICVLREGNEFGKGGHRHYGELRVVASSQHQTSSTGPNRECKR